MEKVETVDELNKSLIWVRWEDCRMMVGDTHTVSTILPPIYGEDVGWLVKETNDYIAIALERFDKDPQATEHFYRHVSIIPRRQIVEIKKFTI